MSGQLDTEDWKAFRKEWQEHKAGKRSYRTTQVYNFCAKRGVQVEELTEFHLRLTFEGKETVNVFPTSGKINIKGQAFKKVDLIPWLTKYYK